MNVISRRHPGSPFASPAAAYRLRPQRTALPRVLLPLLTLTLFSLPLIGAETPSIAGIPASRTVSVTSFGANGVDDRDDTAAIQKAIDSVASQGGGTVLFPAGTYIVNSAPNEGFLGSVWMKSNVRLLGVGGRQSIIKMPAGSRTDAADRRGRQNRSAVMIGDRSYVVSETQTSTVLDRSKWQENIEIAHLGFDLDNGGGRRAIQMRFATRNVRIHHCEGFQSGIEAGQVAQEGLTMDNHFFNMASYGAPVDQGVQLEMVDVSQNITVDNNVVRGFLQLTADGGSGLRNLWIHHNKVYDPQEFGIAITFTGAMDTIMEDLLIEDNEIFAAGGAGIVVWPNFIGGDMDLSKVSIQALRRVTIRRNKIVARPVTYAGQSGPSGRTTVGIGFGAFLTDTRDIRIEDNELTAENPQNLSNSRQAFRMNSWDLNWTQCWRNQHGGALPIIAASGFNASTRMITLSAHGLRTGVGVQLTALGSIGLPRGIDPYRTYRFTRIDDNRFSLAQLSGELVMFDSASAGGSYALSVAPVAENVVITKNKLTGTWDWDADCAVHTRNLRVYENWFCSRFTFSGSHESLSFFANECAGTLNFANCTLLDSRFYENSWSLVDSPACPDFGSAICSFGSTIDPWRRVEAIFESNRFSFSPQRYPRIVSAIGMAPDSWRGTGALRIRSNQLVTPTTLNWNVAPQFLTEFSASEFTNPPRNAVINPGFELISVGANSYYSYVYRPASPGWSFTGHAGIAGNQSAFTSGNPNAPEGSQIAFIQQSGAMEQVIPLRAGTYVLSAFTAQRAVWQQQPQSIRVFTGAEQVGAFSTQGSNYVLAMSKAFTVTEGSHTIRFAGQATLDGTAFLDRISLHATLPIANSGFESPNLGASGWSTYRYCPSYAVGVQPWTFEGNAGITGSNSGFTVNNPNPPDGAQVAFLQSNDAAVSRSITIPTNRSYTLSVAAAKRGNYNLAEQTVNVFLDGNSIGAIVPHSTEYKIFSIPFTSTAGVHQLKFTSTSAADSTAFIDQVTIY